MEGRNLNWPKSDKKSSLWIKHRLCFNLVSEASKEGAFKVKDDETDKDVAERQPSPLGPNESNFLLGTSQSRQRLTVRAPSHAELAEIANSYPPPKRSRLNNKAASTASSALQSRDKARLPNTASSALPSRNSKARLPTTVDEDNENEDEDEDDPPYKRSRLSFSALSSRSSKARLPITDSYEPTASKTVSPLPSEPGPETVEDRRNAIASATPYIVMRNQRTHKALGSTGSRISYLEAQS
jgi:hypothetical protein